MTTTKSVTTVVTGGVGSAVAILLSATATAFHTTIV